MEGLKAAQDIKENKSAILGRFEMILASEIQSAMQVSVEQGHRYQPDAKTVCHVLDVIENCALEGPEYAVKVLQETGLVKYADSVFSTFTEADGCIHGRIQSVLSKLVDEGPAV